MKETPNRDWIIINVAEGTPSGMRETNVLAYVPSMLLINPKDIGYPKHRVFGLGPDGKTVSLIPYGSSDEVILPLSDVLKK